MPNIDDLRDFITDMLKPIRNRVYTMITRAVIETANDAGGMQLLKLALLAGENDDDVERFQNFGFTSVPPDGSEALALAVGGNREHLIVIAADDRRVRIKGLEKGESAFYNDKGDKIVIKANGDIELTNSNDLKLNVGNDIALDVSNNLTGTVTKNIDLTLEKIKLSNGADEVIDLLIQELTALIAEPFIINKATFTIIKTKLEAFKV